MKKIESLLLIALAGLLATACFVDDPGPMQGTERYYSIVDFDRLEMGDALHIEVLQGDFFAVSARGDRRNVDDLIVAKEGSTLVVRFDKNRQRRHDTHLSVTMPVLRALHLSGATDSRVAGFSDAGDFDVHLSGASVCQLDVDANHLRVALSGASYLSLRGGAQSLDADVSGASALKAFHFPVEEAEVMLAGASNAEVTVSARLDVVATGASHLSYRGNPAVSSELSGSSSIHQD